MTDGYFPLNNTVQKSLAGGPEQLWPVPSQKPDSRSDWGLSTQHFWVLRSSAPPQSRSNGRHSLPWRTALFPQGGEHRYGSRSHDGGRQPPDLLQPALQGELTHHPVVRGHEHDQHRSGTVMGLQ